MSARRGIGVVVRQPADGGETPNAFRPETTVQIKAHWPPKEPLANVLAALHAAVLDATVALQEEAERHLQPGSVEAG